MIELSTRSSRTSFTFRDTGRRAVSPYATPTTSTASWLTTKSTAYLAWLPSPLSHL
jgi:hypothetical protein